MKTKYDCPSVKRSVVRLGVGAMFAIGVFAVANTFAQTVPADPGVRPGDAGAGDPLLGLTQQERKFFERGLEDFAEAEGVGDGLGPRFNLDGCAGCHIAPAVGGTSPAVNPQVEMATLGGARNTVPSFITVDGPIREPRFKFKADGTRDGGVHNVFVLSGRIDESGDASDCDIKQPDFESELARGNVIFRIPTPVFGAGLIEAIPDATIVANMSANSTLKRLLGISGRPNRNGNDGRISRFGWKAQDPSLLLFAGEAYNVEMGISNEMFQVERDETAACIYASTPNDAQLFDDTGGFPELITAIENFANFMRFLAPPTPSASQPGGATSIALGRAAFTAIGCALCHTPTMKTASHATVAALRNRDANLFSDLLLHGMGPGLADNIVQGEARPDEFRTAPLWGLGKRIFFLHDGRTSDLLAAIQAHRSAGNAQFPASEANIVIDVFNGLGASTKQDILNFLRSL